MCICTLIGKLSIWDESPKLGWVKPAKLTMLAVHYGLGKHIEVVPLNKLVKEGQVCASIS